MREDFWTSLLDFLGLLAVASGIGWAISLPAGVPLGLLVGGLVILCGSAVAAGRFTRRRDGER